MDAAGIVEKGAVVRVRFAPLHESAKALPNGLASIIVDGRRESPWKEQWRCSKCNHNFLVHPTDEQCTWCHQGVVQQLWTERRAEQETLEALHQRCSQVTAAFVVEAGHPILVGMIELRPVAMDQLNEQVGADVIAGVLRHFGRSGAYFFVHHLIVAPQWRSQGIGSKLLDQAIKRAQPDARSGIPLICLASRTPVAQDWFAKHQLAAVQFINDRHLLVGNVVRSA